MNIYRLFKICYQYSMKLTALITYDTVSFYLDKMRMLPTEHPEIYELFHSRHFVVKTNTGSFYRGTHLHHEFKY